MKAVILAGGNGTRFSDVIPKTLLPINGKAIIEHQIELLRSHNIKDIAIVVGARSYTPVMGLLEDGSKYGVDITYFFQGTSATYGMPSAIYAARSFITEPTFVLCGDNYITTDLSAMSTRFWSSECIVVCIRNMIGSQAEKFAVYWDDTREFVEKPTLKKNEMYRIYAGPIILGPHAVSMIPGLSVSDRGELEITHLFNMLPNVELYKDNSVWFDIGDTMKYAAATIDLNEGK